MQLVGAVCRPPRDFYEESDLVGGIRSSFAFGATRAKIKKYYRQDIELTNNRNQKLQCSHYRPCVVTSSDGRLPCVIYCHTNSGSRRDAEEILFTLLPKGITVFALDFSGSGRSDGDWVTLGAHEVDDLATAVQYIRDEGSTSTLALWGRSMGAATALMYSHRDPSIAGIVVDSPFSRLTDLMLELATDSQSGLSVPRPLVKVALTMMRRSVRKKAGFDIDDVAPLDVAKESYVPVLFGHAKGDSFIPVHHSERLFEAHGADTKNIITFDEDIDHNGPRPEFWYDSGLIFLLGVLRVEELVGPDIDIHSIDLEQAPHMRGGGIYVTGRGARNDGGGGGGGGDDNDDDEDEARAVLVGKGRTRSVAVPWDVSNSRLNSAVVERHRRPSSHAAGGGRRVGGGVSSNANTSARRSIVGNVSDYNEYENEEESRGLEGEQERVEEEGDEDEDLILQRVLELSLMEAQSRQTQENTSSLAPPPSDNNKGSDDQNLRSLQLQQQQQKLQQEQQQRKLQQLQLQQQQQQGRERRLDRIEEYDEETALAAAIAESLKAASSSPPNTNTSIGTAAASHAMPAELSTPDDLIDIGQSVQNQAQHQFAASEHAQREADAVHRAVEDVHHTLEDLIAKGEEGSSSEVLEEKRNVVGEVSKSAAAEGAQEASASSNENEGQQLEEDFLERLRAESAKLAGNK